MRKGKKALLIVGAMILTIASLAVLNFVRSKMEANDQSAKTAAARVSDLAGRAA
jgi:type II secretory pathway pseudopilin PulG